MEKFLRRVIQNFQHILDQIGQFFRVLVTPVEIEKPKNKEKRSGANTMERFTQPARQVLIKAHEAARSFGHEKIDLEHLLLAMARVQNCTAYDVFADLQIGEANLANQVKRAMPSTVQPLKNRDLSEDMKKSLELSVADARQAGHHYIGSEHMLIGVMRVNKPAINSILAQFGTDAKTVIEHTEKVLKQRNNSKGTSDDR